MDPGRDVGKEGVARGLTENVLKYFGSHMNFPTLHNPSTSARKARNMSPEAGKYQQHHFGRDESPSIRRLGEPVPRLGGDVPIGNSMAVRINHPIK